jgi:hypothetical protein
MQHPKQKCNSTTDATFRRPAEPTATRNREMHHSTNSKFVQEFRSLEFRSLEFRSLEVRGVEACVDVQMRTPLGLNSEPRAQNNPQ